MTTDKTTFFSELYNSAQGTIYITDKTDELEKEVASNLRLISVPKEIIPHTTKKDFLLLFDEVKRNLKEQLENCDIDIDLIFYLWHDEQAGQLRFNVINSNHKSLPFACAIQLTSVLEEIVDSFINSDNTDGAIPWDEIKFIDHHSDNEISPQPEREFILTVYKEILQKA